MFSDIGKVYSAHVVGLEPSTGKSRGYGFVTFADAESCTAAVTRMHKTVVEGRTINVRLVEERDVGGEGGKSVVEPGKGVGVGKDANKVIVAGLSQSMTDERLQLICEEFGLVLRATVVRHPQTQKSRGFGFVTFTNKQCQQACIAKLDKRELGGGRVLNVRAVETRISDGADAKGGAKDKDTANPDTAAAAAAGPGGAASSATRGKESAVGATGRAAAAAAADTRLVCLKFQVGKCHRGRGCRFRHEKVKDAAALNQRLAAAAAAAAAAETAAAPKDGAAGAAPRRGAKKGWGGEAHVATAVGDLESESEGEEEKEETVAGVPARRAADRPPNPPAAPSRPTPAAVSVAQKVPGPSSSGVVEFGGGSSEEDNDDADEEEGPARPASMPGTVVFDDGSDDGGSDYEGFVAMQKRAVAAFDDSDSDGDGGGGNHESGRDEAGRQGRNEPERAALEAEASRSLSIMASLLSGGSEPKGQKKKLPSAKKSGVAVASSQESGSKKKLKR